MTLRGRLAATKILQPLRHRDFVIGAILMFGLLFVPGVRDPERDPTMTATASKPAEP